VVVYEPVTTLEGLRADQVAVVAPVRLARGDTIRWPLPVGLFWLDYRRASSTSKRPVVTVKGPITCIPALAPDVDHTTCLVRGSGASVRLAYPATGTTELAGHLSLERQRYP
jgi:hypothetical protein